MWPAPSRRLARHLIPDRGAKLAPKSEPRIGKINGLFAPPRPPPASGPPPPAAAACSRRWRRPQPAAAAGERGVQQDVARLCALWTCRSRWVTLRTQGFPGARASGRPVWGGNDRLRRNHGVVASFSRALAEGLAVQQSDAEYNALLDEAIQSIFDASMNKVHAMEVG
jgi:hypothetical protein